MAHTVSQLVGRVKLLICARFVRVEIGAPTACAISVSHFVGLKPEVQSLSARLFLLFKKCTPNFRVSAFLIFSRKFDGAILLETSCFKEEISLINVISSYLAGFINCELNIIISTLIIISK